MKRRQWRKIIYFIFLFSINLGFVYAEKEDYLWQKLRNRITQISERLDGILGVTVKDLEKGDTIFINENEIFPQASSIKIAILLEVFKQVEEGKIKFNEFIDLKKEMKVGGSGILQILGEPSISISIKDLCKLMIVLSDNTATNILIGRVGIDSVNKRMESLGLKMTKFNRKMMDIEASRVGNENLSTPYEMMVLLEKIWKGEILKEPFQREFLKILSIPKESYLRKRIPANIPVASKPGSLPGVRCESGIVIKGKRPYILCVMTTFLKKPEDGELVISEISKLVYEHFSILEKSNSFGRSIE